MLGRRPNFASYMKLAVWKVEFEFKAKYQQNIIEASIFLKGVLKMQIRILSLEVLVVRKSRQFYYPESPDGYNFSK